MAKQDIKLNIGGRIYPISINSEEEEIIRKMGKDIEEMMKDIATKYDIKDKQDALAMAAMSMISEAQIALQKIKKETESSNQKVENMISMLDELDV